MSTTALPTRSCVGCRVMRLATYHQKVVRPFSCPRRVGLSTPLQSSPATPKRNWRCAARGSHSVYFFGSQDPTISVVKLQLAVFGRVAEIQAQLDRIANSASTGDNDELCSILHETSTVMLNNLPYCSYGYAITNLVNDEGSAEVKFNSHSIQERSKFSAETLSNVDGTTTQRVVPLAGSLPSSDQWLCITFILAAEKMLKLPTISSATDLKHSLLMMSDVQPDEMLAFELLWTPQEPGDQLSKDQLLLDYPQLRMI